MVSVKRLPCLPSTDFAAVGVTPACLGCTWVGVSEAMLIPAVLLCLSAGCVCLFACEAVPALFGCSALLTAATADAGLCATCCAFAA